MHYIVIGLFIPVVALGLMFLVGAMFELSPGLAPGIFAGANTATPGLGAAHAALAGSASAPGSSAEAATANLSTAFAFAYCVSVVLFTVMIKVPDLIGRRTTAEAAKELEAALAGPDATPLPGSAEEFLGTSSPVDVREYEASRPETVGHRLGELRGLYPALSIERVLRGGELLELRDELEVRAHDTVALYGRIPALVEAGPRIGPEIYAAELGDRAPKTVDVIVHDDRIVGHTLRELAAGYGHGLYLNAMFRAGEPVPHGSEAIVHKGDVLRVTGTSWRIEELARQTGHIVRPSLTTDVTTLAVAAALGALLGMITIPIGSVQVTVGAAVGLLLVGMTISILRTRNPAFGGPFPEPARRLIEDLGLNVFVAVLGLNAGMGVLKALGEGAVGPILIGTLIVGFVPPILAWILGRKLFHMNEALLLGAVSGGRCSSPGMRASIEAARSSVPAISYPATFAISNIVLTLFSYLMAVLH